MTSRTHLLVQDLLGRRPRDDEEATKTIDFVKNLVNQLHKKPSDVVSYATRNDKAKDVMVIALKTAADMYKGVGVIKLPSPLPSLTHQVSLTAWRI